MSSIFVRRELIRIRTPLIAIAIVAATLTACSKVSDPGVPVAAVPDVDPAATQVIIISMDTTRADWFGCYGHPWIQTPNIDRLAQDSLVFERCYTPIPETLPAHLSLLTGLYPHTHGIARNGQVVHKDVETLGHVLGAQGYTTAGFISAMPLMANTGINRGFMHFEEDFADPGDTASAEDKLTRPAKYMTEAVIRYLDTIDSAAPLFLFVHYYDPHLSYRAPQEFVDRYASVPFDPAQVTAHLAFPNPGQYIPKPFSGPKMPNGLRGYAAELTYTDEHIGVLLDDLKQRGIYDDAIIVLTADHGESLWDQPPYFHHAMTLFDSTLHIPAIVKLPKSAHAGTRVATPVSLLDWAPSILEALGLPILDGTEGRALDLLHGARDLAPVTHYAEGSRPYNATDPSRPWLNALMEKSITEGDYRLILRPYLAGYAAGAFKPDPFDPVPPPRGEVGLYNIKNDPRGLVNLLDGPEADAKYGELVRQLRSKLDAWIASAKPMPVTRTQLDGPSDDTKEKLKALGYAQ